MTDHIDHADHHLTDARKCVDSASQAHVAADAIAWLTDACMQIVTHLEAQQTEASLRRGLADIAAGRTVDLGSFAQPATDPPAAQQCDSGYTPLPHEGFARLVDGGVHLGKPDSVAQAEGQRWLDGIRAEVREQIASELIPVVAHKGPNDTDLSLLDEAAHKLEHGYSFGSNVTAAVVRLIRNAIRIARQEQP